MAYKLYTVKMITEEEIKELQERVLRQKMEELFAEPSTYEDELDDEYYY